MSGDVGVRRVVVAELGRRALTRAADAVLMVALGLAGALVASVMVALLAIPFLTAPTISTAAPAAAASCR